jgi:hypothetical protein
VRDIAGVPSEPRSRGIPHRARPAPDRCPRRDRGPREPACPAP